MSTPEKTMSTLLLEIAQGLATASLFGIAVWYQPMISLILLGLSFLPLLKER